MKMRVEAQTLQPGDITQSGAKVLAVNVTSKFAWIIFELNDNIFQPAYDRYKMININRPEMVTSFQIHEPKSWNGISHK